MRNIKNRLLFLFLLVAVFVQAQEIPEPQSPARLVNDFAGILQPNEIASLEDSLVRFEKSTSTQIIVVTVKSLDGTEPSDFAQKLGEKWGVGQKGKNNGIVILVKPKIDREKGHAYISIGYGLEGVLPDVIASRIVRNEMIPRFKQNDYFGGIAAAAVTVMQITKGEYTADQYDKKSSGGYGKYIFFGIIALFIILILVAKGGSDHNQTLGGSAPFWLAMGMLAGSSRGGGSYGNFSSGGGSFGGFGGGSFGGGGAGGSW